MKQKKTPEKPLSTLLHTNLPWIHKRKNNENKTLNCKLANSFTSPSFLWVSPYFWPSAIQINYYNSFLSCHIIPMNFRMGFILWCLQGYSHKNQKKGHIDFIPSRHIHPSRFLNKLYGVYTQFATVTLGYTFLKRLEGVKVYIYNKFHLISSCDFMARIVWTCIVSSLRKSDL